MAGGVASEYIGMWEVFLYNAGVAFITFFYSPSLLKELIKKMLNLCNFFCWNLK
jgi:hypothetical protein